MRAGRQTRHIAAPAHQHTNGWGRLSFLCEIFRQVPLDDDDVRGGESAASLLFHHRALFDFRFVFVQFSLPFCREQFFDFLSIFFFFFFPFYLSFSISWSYKRWASSERSQKRKNKLTMSTQSVRFRGINWPRSLLSGVITMLHVNYKDALKEKKKTKNRAMEWKERTWTGAILCSLLFSYSLNVTIHDRR